MRPQSFDLRFLAPITASAALMVTSCGNSSDGITACRSRSPALAESVYGCITQSNDVGNPPPPASPLSGFSVDIFQSTPPPTPDDGLSPYVETKSDTSGYYEIGLTSGNYWICTSFRRCVTLTVPATMCVALDYDFGAGPGWSSR